MVGRGHERIEGAAPWLTRAGYRTSLCAKFIEMMPTERTVRVAGTTLLLREWGSGGPAAVFWHALGDHTSLQMVEAGPILVEEFGLRVIGVDAPGFGGSQRLRDDEYSIAALTSFAARLLDELDVSLPAWIGSSWGGVIGVHVAAEHAHRLSALVLVDGGYLDEQVELEAETLAGLQEQFRKEPGFRYPDWETLFDECRQLFGRWNPALESYVRSGFRDDNGAIVSIMGPDLFAAGVHFLVNAPLDEAQAKLGVSKLPVLLLAALEPPEDEESRARSIGRFQDRVPGAEVRRVAAPHLMLESQPVEVARVIGPWLRARHAEPSAAC